MIGQMIVLLRVKELRQEQAFRALRAKRAEVEQAIRETQEALQIVQDSAATLPVREDAIYAEVIGRVIDPGEVDDTRGKVVQLEKDHAVLKDAWERAAHVQARLESELEVVVERYKQSTKARDKYVIITDDMKKEIDDTANYREESEIEDIFARPKRAAL